MNKHIRLLAVLLIAAMLCSLFNACGTSKKKITSSKKTKSSSVSDTQSDNSTENTTSSVSSSKPGTNTSSSKNSSSAKQSATADTSSSTATDDSGKANDVIENYDGVERTVKVSLNKTLSDRYDGFGGNIVPFSYMPSNTGLGYNEAYYSLDAQRMNTMSIDIIRFWCQVDWFEKTKGNYDFNTPEMFALCKYIEACEKAGCKAQLTFTWKVGPSVQGWYSIPGLASPELSAPNDLEAFGKSCAALIKYLKVTKGYDCVSYLTFANEPNGSWDFECYGDQCAYFTTICEYVDSELKKQNLRDKVEIWFCELAFTDGVSWYNYAGSNASSAIDGWSMHQYEFLNGTLSPVIDAITVKKPFYLTEFNEVHNTSYGEQLATSWQRSFAGMLIDGSKSGLAGVLNWCVFGVRSMSATSTNSWQMESDGSRNQHYWANDLAVKYIPGIPSYTYYQCSLFSRYIEQKSKVVGTDVTLSNSDMRASTFVSKNGEISIVVESNSSDTSRELTVDFGEKVNKTFTRHVYRYDDYNDAYLVKRDGTVEYYNDIVTKINQNSIIPVAEGTYNCTTSFTDKDIPKGYSVIVYTTIATAKQIGFRAYDDKLATNIGATVAPGGSVNVEAYMIDGANDDELVFAMQSGSGTVSLSGRYTASTNPAENEVVAIKAYYKNDPTNYKVFLIKVSN